MPFQTVVVGVDGATEDSRTVRSSDQVSDCHVQVRGRSWRWAAAVTGIGQRGADRLVVDQSAKDETDHVSKPGCWIVVLARR